MHACCRHLVVVAVLLWSAGVSTALSPCPSGRVFVGNINSSFPGAVRFNGIYKVVVDDSTAGKATLDGHPIYRHEQRVDQFIHHVTSAAALGHWMIGLSVNGNLPVSGSEDGLASVAAPEELGGGDGVTSPLHRWLIHDAGGGWYPAGGSLKVSCVDDMFVTCTSGRLVISGLSERHRRVQGRRTGRFAITPCSNQLRPVYRHLEHDEFLFFVDGLWIVGPAVGRVSGGLFVHDAAWRPEHVLNDWHVFIPTFGGFERDLGLRVTCDDGPASDDEVGEQTDSAVSPPPEAGSFDIIPVDDNTSASSGINVRQDSSSSSRQYPRKRQHLAGRRQHATRLTSIGLTACSRRHDDATICADGLKRCTQQCTACVCGYENSVPECTNGTKQRFDVEVERFRTKAPRFRTAARTFNRLPEIEIVITEASRLFLSEFLKCHWHGSVSEESRLPKCWATVQCGDPPPSPSSNVTGSSSIVASTGVSFLDTVFYRCPPAGVGTSTSATGDRSLAGRVCQASGTWSEPYPRCSETPGGILITPEHPQLIPPAFPTGRRRHRVTTK